MSAQANTTNTTESIDLENIDLREIVQTDDWGRPVNPDARVTIDFTRPPELGQWLAYDPSDLTGYIGVGDTKAQAVVDYGKKVEAHMEAQNNE